MREKKASKQQVATMGCQLDFEYFNHVIKLSYYFPMNTRKGKTTCLTPVTETSICTFFPVSPAYQFNHHNYVLFGHCSSFLHGLLLHSSPDSFLLNVNLHLHVRALVQQAPLSSESRKFYKLSNVNIWMSSK